jgi:UMF1 family MFS transporter
MFFIEPGSWFFAGLLLVISNFGFTLSEMTIASFLPGMVEKKSIGKVSGWGWAFGYIGGLLSLVLAFKLTHFNYDLNNWSQLRFLGPMIAVFFIVASLPTLLFVPEPKLSIPLLSKSTSWQSDLRIIFSDRKLRFFLLCYFLIHGNVMTAVSFSALLGTQVAGVVGSEQAVFYIGFQVVAASGAFLFGKITDWLGNQRTLQINLVLWLIGIGLMTELIFFPLAEIVGKKAVFYCAGAWCGLSLGATLSNSRALVAEFAPEGAGGRALGIWSAVGSLASIAAVVTFGKVQTFFSLSQSLYLVWGGFLLAFFLLRSKSFSR